MKRYLRLICELPPAEVVRRARRKIISAVTRSVARRRDRKSSTYDVGPDVADARTDRFARVADSLGSMQPAGEVSDAGSCMKHRFDLLGSGPVELRHGMDCEGLDGHSYGMGRDVDADGDGAWLEGRVNAANLAEARRIWRLVDAGYRPIDWHLDFKSGFRWREDAWYLDLLTKEWPEGVDSKVPRELARMQHLPRLALEYVLTREPGEPSAEELAREFRNQILDFTATNPPRFGVNWMCTMDVAIRAANWAVAYGIFRSGGAEFDEPFAAVFVRSVREHGKHIAENLEDYHRPPNNHYLADIVGQLFVAACLPRDEETDKWLVLAAKELVGCVEKQFHEEGSNFEASTSYHRFAAEMVRCGTAVIEGLSPAEQELLSGAGSALPKWCLERMAKMDEFTADVTRPDGNVAQFGDNDSGRFLGLRLAVPESPSPGEGLRTYPQFGLYVYRTARMYLAVRCGSIGQGGHGGHAHNDQLSFELAIDGKPLIVDPGTYVYTPLPAQRNLFRSTGSHNTLTVEGREQNQWPAGRPGLFELRDEARARVTEVAAGEFAGEHEGFDCTTERRIRIADGGLGVVDRCSGAGMKTVSFHLAPGVEAALGDGGAVELQANGVKAVLRTGGGDPALEAAYHSPRYGVLEDTKVVRLRTDETELEWSICW